MSKVPFRLLGRTALALCALAVMSAAGAASQRTFVASYGSDASATCSLAAPCRAFAAAIAQTNPGGEVIVLDSAGYGPVTITKAVSIIAPAGVYAGVSVATGDGIVVNAGATDVVKLRGLRLNGTGGANGIVATAVGLLDVADVEVSGFTNRGLDFAAPGGMLLVADSAFTGNGGDGLHVESASTRALATLVRSRFDRNVNGAVIGANARAAITESSASYNSSNGMFVKGGSTANIGDCTIASNDAGAYGITVRESGTSASIVRCKVAGGAYGVYVADPGAKAAVADSTVTSSTAAGIAAGIGAQVTAERCTVSASLHGFVSGTTGSIIYVSNSTVVDNTTDAFYLYQPDSLVYSRNNNTVRGNGATSTGPGTFTTFPAQ
jgi:hypothetical protein